MEHFSEEDESSMSIVEDSFSITRKKKPMIIISDSDSETDVSSSGSPSRGETNLRKPFIILNSSSDMNVTLELSDPNSITNDMPQDTVGLANNMSFQEDIGSGESTETLPVLANNMSFQEDIGSGENAESLPDLANNMSFQEDVCSENAKPLPAMKNCVVGSDSISNLSAVVSTVSKSTENLIDSTSDSESDFPRFIKPDIVQIVENESENINVGQSLDYKQSEEKLNKLLRVSNSPSETNLKDECIVLSSDQEYTEVITKLSEHIKTEKPKVKVNNNPKVKGAESIKERAINTLQNDIASLKYIQKTTDLETVPNCGIGLQFQIKDKEKQLKVLQDELKSAQGTKTVLPPVQQENSKKLQNPKLMGPENMKEREINTLQNEIDKLKCILKTTNLEALPDRGIRMQFQINDKEKQLKVLKDELKNAQGTKTVLPPVQQENSKKLQNTNSTFPSDSFEPQGMGAKAMETYRVQKALTMDALQQLHTSLETCPDENTFAEDPRGLRSTVQLMPHQKRALAWLLWRENKRPRGGILADDMGLGKTLTMISLVLAKKENKEKYKYSSSEEDSDVENKENWFSRDSNLRGGTLVICPASLLNQWEGEVQKRCKNGALDVEVYHGTNREDRSRRLARRDMVITTYNLVRSEESRNGLLFKMKWERIILDEAHVIRNHKSKCSLAICRLKSHFKWVLTGTPIQNKEQDMFALLKFLRCSPFDDLTVWKKWVDNKNSSGQQRLTTLLNTLMLRRTKQQLQEVGTIQCLPDKTMEVVDVTLDKEEFEVYEQVLHLSKSLFAQFLHQKASKEQGLTARFSDMPTFMQKPGPDNPFKLNSELAALHSKMNDMPIVKSFEILMLLLRLRQLCCHPSLIQSLMDRESCDLDGIEYENNLEHDVTSQFSSLALQDTSETVPHEATNQSSEKKIFSPSNPVFQGARASSKMRKLFEILEEKVLSCGDKAVIISQWTSMLQILKEHLTDRGVSCITLCGSVAVKDRMGIVDSFNKPNTKPQVLLLSLTAGGVGLNLIGGNHLFLFDLHWNPQLESQACDRIYRVGQTKPVYIYKFVCEETIEQMISQLQKKKLDMADAVLTGARHTNVNKLSLEDLRMIFNL